MDSDESLAAARRQRGEHDMMCMARDITQGEEIPMSDGTRLGRDQSKKIPGTHELP
jgi:hypothetical protein